MKFFILKFGKKSQTTSFYFKVLYNSQPTKEAFSDFHGKGKQSKNCSPRLLQLFNPLWIFCFKYINRGNS